MNQEFSSLLVAQLWQVTLLAAVVWLAVGLLAKDRPHLAHGLWVLVLIKCITPPVWSSPASPFSWIQAHRVVEFSQPANLPESNESETANEPASVGDTIVVHVNRSSNTTQQTPSLVAPKPGVITDREAESPVVAFLWNNAAWTLWLGGAAIGLALTLLRFTLFLHWTNKSRIAVEPRLEQTIARLSKRLGIKRPVRIRVLDSPVGPAVLGLFRPTILLPASIVNDRDQNTLGLLLAHELIHIRRGDLWWAMVQTLAGCLFWFHPLVRLAVKMVTRESERSCDEETVASLGCSPKAYARGLLKVLEQKQRLQVAPALPGVRPVDITSARLERVMKFGHGSHKRTPLWVWIVMLVCGATVLPGAAMVFGQQGEPLVFANPQGNFNLATDVAAWRLESYDVADLLAKVDKTGNLDLKPTAKLIRMLPCRRPGPDAASCTPRGQSIDFAAGDNGEFGFVSLGDTEPTMKIFGNRLYVYGSASDHECVVTNLEQMRAHGFQQVLVEVRFITGNPEVWNDLGFDWSDASPGDENASVSAVETVGAITAMPEVTFDAGAYVDPEFKLAARAAELKRGKKIDGCAVYPDMEQVTRFSALDEGQQTITPSGLQRQLPAQYAVINSEQMQEVLARIKHDAATNIMQAPTLTMINGHDGMVKDGSVRPFVISLQKISESDGNRTVYQPQIGLVEEGATVKINPTIQDDGTIRLVSQLMVTEIEDVQEFTFGDADSRNEDGKERQLSVQLPVVAIQGLSATVDVPDGEMLVVSTKVPRNPKVAAKNDSMLVMMRCVVIDQAFTPPTQSPGNSLGQVQPVTRFAPLPPGSELYYVAADGSARLIPASKLVTNATGTKSQPVSPAEQEDPDSRLVIRSSLDRPSEAGFEPVVHSLEGTDLRLQIETNVELKMIKDGLMIRGENLEVVSGKNDSFFVSGESGEIEICRNDRYKMCFTGNVKLRIDQEVKATAQNLVHHFSEDGVKIVLSGDAEFKSEFFDLAGEVVSLDESETVILEGDACLKRPQDDGSWITLKAERIRWNTDSDEIDATKIKSRLISKPAEKSAGMGRDQDETALQSGQPLPSAYYLKDDIQYFRKGPELHGHEPNKHRDD